MSDSKLINAVEHLENIMGDPLADGKFCYKTAVVYDEEDAFPSEHVQLILESGFFKYYIPREYGGKLDDFNMLVFLCRVISRRDLSTAIALGQVFLGSLPVWLSDNEECKKILTKRLENGQLGCLALTEKKHGSDILSTEVQAQEQDGYYCLSGEKWLINNATRGDMITVLARVIPENGGAYLALFYLCKDSLSDSQYSCLDKIYTHGIRGADISGIQFKQCQIPASAMLSGGGKPIYLTFKALQISRILCTGFSLGAMDTAFRATYDFAARRKLYAKYVVDMPVASSLLISSFINITIADVLARVTARGISQIPTQLSLWSAIVKYLVPVLSEENFKQLGTVLGARYYLREEHWDGIFQKMLRDNAVVGLFDGSSQVNLGIISSQLPNLLSHGVRPTTYLIDHIDDNIAALFNLDIEAILGDVGLLNEDKFLLSNDGYDALMHAFICVGANIGAINMERNEPLSKDTLSLIAATLKEYRNLVMQMKRLEQTGMMEPTSTVRYDMAHYYSILFAAGACVLNWYYNCNTHTLLKNDTWLFLALKNLLSRFNARYPELDYTDEEQRTKLMRAVHGYYENNELISFSRIRLAS